MRIQAIQQTCSTNQVNFGRSLPNYLRQHPLSPRAKSKIGVVMFSGVIAAAAAYLADNIHAFLPTMAVTLPITNWIDKKLENHVKQNDNKTNIVA